MTIRKKIKNIFREQLRVEGKKVHRLDGDHV